MSAFFYRVIPNFGGIATNPNLCAHDWQREDYPALTAYCAKCKNNATLSEDERNRPPEWWKEYEARTRAMNPPSIEVRQLE